MFVDHLNRKSGACKVRFSSQMSKFDGDIQNVEGTFAGNGRANGKYESTKEQVYHKQTKRWYAYKLIYCMIIR